MKLLSLVLIFNFTIINGYANPNNKNKDEPTRLELPTTQNEITCEYDNGYLVISFEHESGRTHLSLSKVSDNSIINEIEISSTCQFVHYIGQIDEPIMVNITTPTSSHSEIIY
ncbi:hypothetical protein [uncultured Duncaniella sp.]|uniref:hypothetical protein n=1 Tax=uncultured Duncaniella sp. TaxID=2768039 RepID=UPI0025F0883C|nr:hypothetical protein [uncultured Duncaniella sp.]